MSFNQTFSIVNKSKYKLTLDENGSKDLGDGEWPTTVGPNSTSPSFGQNGFFSVNPTAVYIIDGANKNAYLHFYCAGVAPGVRVNMTMQFSNGALFTGSAIAENNSTNGHEYVTKTASPGTTLLEIGEFGNGSSRGTAIFTIGAA